MDAMLISTPNGTEPRHNLRSDYISLVADGPSELRVQKGNIMKLMTKASVATLVLLGTLSGAQATMLANNSFVNSVDFAPTSFGGMLLNQSTTLISNVSYNGTARTSVYDTGTGLDFYYQFTNNRSSLNGVERLTGYDFTSLGASIVGVFQTKAAFGQFIVGTESSDGADRTSSGVVGFNFIPNGQSKINPGSTSFTQIIRTNARNYTAGNFGLLDGIGDNAPGFAPTSAVPEPETYSMLLAGLGLMGAIARRRNKAKEFKDTTTA
jgi:hypothetical protein